MLAIDQKLGSGCVGRQAIIRAGMRLHIEHDLAVSEHDAKLLQATLARPAHYHLVKLISVKRSDMPTRLNKPGVTRKRFLILQNPPVDVGARDVDVAAGFLVLLEIGPLARDRSQEVHVLVGAWCLPSLPGSDRDPVRNSEIPAIQILRNPGRWGGRLRRRLHGVLVRKMTIQNDLRSMRGDDFGLNRVIYFSPVPKSTVGFLELPQAVLLCRWIVAVQNTKTKKKFPNLVFLAEIFRTIAIVCVVIGGLIAGLCVFLCVRSAAVAENFFDPLVPLIIGVANLLAFMVVAMLYRAFAEMIYLALYAATLLEDIRNK